MEKSPAWHIAKRGISPAISTTAISMVIILYFQLIFKINISATQNQKFSRTGFLSRCRRQNPFRFR